MRKECDLCQTSGFHRRVIQILVLLGSFAPYVGSPGIQTCVDKELNVSVGVQTKGNVCGFIRCFRVNSAQGLRNSSCLSACLFALSVRLPLDGFSWNLIPGIITQNTCRNSKCCWNRTKIQALYTKTSECFIRFGATKVVQEYRENIVVPPWQCFQCLLRFRQLSRYVTNKWEDIVVCQLQQWLHECVTTLRCTCIACLVSQNFRFEFPQPLEEFTKQI